MKVQIRHLLTIAVLLLTSMQSVKAEPAPQRVVVAGGSITEIIYALGEQQRIAGVDSTSIFPLAATEKPQIGYVRKINVEGVLSLNPDLLLGKPIPVPRKWLSNCNKLD